MSKNELQSLNFNSQNQGNPNIYTYSNSNDPNVMQQKQQSMMQQGMMQPGMMQPGMMMQPE